MNSVDPAFLAHLARRSGLDEARCERLVEEVLHEYRETLAEFVQRRHGELKAQTGLRNEAIYGRIREEAEARPFAVDPLTERQIRRLIYG